MEVEVNTNTEDFPVSGKSKLAELSAVELMELGWEIRQCLEGHVHDGRDVARALFFHPVLRIYLEEVDIHPLEPPTKALAKVKQAIRKDLESFQVVGGERKNCGAGVAKERVLEVAGWVNKYELSFAIEKLRGGAAASTVYLWAERDDLTKALFLEPETEQPQGGQKKTGEGNGN